MPLGTLHTVEGIVRREPRRFILAVHGGGTWELEPTRRLSQYLDCSVTVEGVRTGFDRLVVVRIKGDGENWSPQQSWTRWFNRWRKRQGGDNTG